MKALRVPPIYKCIGLVDADLLDNGTRHPNLALLKIAGFLYDNHIPFELILDSNIDLERYDHIYLSRVFTFTKLPKFYTESIGTINENKFHVGGTGFYATIENTKEFTSRRNEDMFKLEKDETYRSFCRLRYARSPYKYRDCGHFNFLRGKIHI